jgi:hypothetical protein
MSTRFALLLVVAVAGQAFGQTMVDLRTQSKSVDFSNLPSTRPVTVGTALPSSCQTGQIFFYSAATAGANLFGCTATNVWTQLSGGAGGGSGSGATMASQLGDFRVSFVGGSLTIGANCSNATPCNVRLGNTVYSFKNPGTVATSGTTSGIVFLYIDNSGNLTAGSPVSLTCSGCTYAPSITSFPADSIPLSTWTITSGAFDASGGADFRATLSTKNLMGGTGVAVSESAGTSTVSIDPSLVSLHVLTPPASSGAACSAGQFSYDATFYYICVAANTWKRLALSSF